LKLSRKTLGIFILVVFGLAAVFLLRFHFLTRDRVANSWDAWIDEKTKIWTEMEVAAHKEAIPFDPIDESELADIRARNRRKLEDFAAEKLAKYASPAEMEANGEGIRLDSVTVTISEPEKYTGVQTVSALMEAFDADYRSGYTNASAEEKYPREEWLAMLLKKGLRVGDYSDYSLYMNLRSNLVHLENEPGTWASGQNGIPPTGDWETFKDAYIDRTVWECQQIYEAKQLDPSVWSGIFVGPGDRTFLPYSNGRIYVERSETSLAVYGPKLTERQEWELAYQGKSPDGFDVVYIDEHGNILTEPPPTVSMQWYRKLWRFLAP
jgi:hypothetical protein